MPNRVILDNVEHATLTVAQRHGAEFGDAVNQILVFPTEFVEVQREYPILFSKDAAGALQAVALLGFERGENLFLDNEQWNARYVPAVQRRGPFFIAVRPDDGEPIVHIDLDDPRVGDPGGEHLFKPHGGNAPYLDHVSEALFTIHEGLSTSAATFAAFAEHDLLQPIEVNLDLGDGLTYSLADYYTIGAQQLAALTGGVLEHFNCTGLLAAAIFARASLPNMNRLVQLKNAKRVGI